MCRRTIGKSSPRSLQAPKSFRLQPCLTGPGSAPCRARQRRARHRRAAEETAGVDDRPVCLEAATPDGATSYTLLGTITTGLEIVKDVVKAGDDGAFAQQAGGGHPKKELDIKALTMS